MESVFGKGSCNDTVIILDDFLDEPECDEFVDLIRERQRHYFEPFTSTGVLENHKWTDAELADRVWHRLMRFVRAHDGLCRPNDLVMAGIYDRPGQRFGIHTDTGLYFSETEETRWTLLVYLNTPAEGGGETVFYNDQLSEVTHKVFPRKGRAVLFDIDVFHEARPIVEGTTKFWISIEIIGNRKQP